MKSQIILGVALTILGIAAAAVIFRPQSQTVNVPFSESWTVKEVINGTTLNATRNRKTRQLQLCGIAIAPGAEQQAQTYLQQLIDNSNNQVPVVTVKRNQDKWLSEVFVRLGEDGEELASALLIIKGLANISPEVSECFYQEGLELAEEIATQE